MTQAATTLEKPDMRIILSVYNVNMEFGAPYLLLDRQWKRAAKLAARGLLKKEADVFTALGGGGYVVTNAGIEVYNAALDAQRNIDAKKPPNLIKHGN